VRARRWEHDELYLLPAGEAARLIVAKRLLWDVLEEHFDQGAFGLFRYARVNQSPLHTLRDLARNPERQLIAHVDGLHCGGPLVHERLLEPAIVEPDEDDLERLSCAAWVLLETGSFGPLAPRLHDDRPGISAALATAARHARRGDLNAWLLSELSKHAEAHAGLLALAEGRQLLVPGLVRHLQSADPSAVAYAARLARLGDPAELLGATRQLLDHADAAVRDAALLAGLSWGEPRAWTACERWALDASQPSALATCLYAALGTRADHQALQTLPKASKARRSVLFALGFSGNTALAPLLFEPLHGSDPVEARLAAQALSMIFGFSLTADEFTLPPRPRTEGRLPPPEEDPEAMAALPALEDDDLDADLIPLPEEQLDEPNVEAIARFCEPRSSMTRVFYGQPFDLELLARAPLRVRHVLALALGVRSAGKFWLDTNAPSAAQREQLRGAAVSGGLRFTGF
jgi:uncharacterized protein (TIGR02270 family)